MQELPQPTAPEPFSAAELRAALYHPLVAIDVLLAQRERWTATLVENRQWSRMAGLLLVWTVVFALPYGCVLSFRHAWQVATLFLGSVALCLPSLHVVSAYLGMRVHAAQSFAIATIMAAVAAIFSCGFAPILWFLHVTAGSSSVSVNETLTRLSNVLLLCAALAGMVHGMLCLRLTKPAQGISGFGFVVLLWQALLLFIGSRMSTALGLS